MSMNSNGQVFEIGKIGFETDLRKSEKALFKGDLVSVRNMKR